MKERKKAYRDGIEMYTRGETFTAPNGEIVEVLYDKADKKSYFVELTGAPACAHGSTVEEAIEEAKWKLKKDEPLTEDEKKEYRDPEFKFSVPIFRRITKACQFGIDEWLEERNLDKSVRMTLKELRAAGGAQWADTLAKEIE